MVCVRFLRWFMDRVSSASGLWCVIDWGFCWKSFISDMTQATRLSRRQSFPRLRVTSWEYRHGCGWARCRRRAYGRHRRRRSTELPRGHVESRPPRTQLTHSGIRSKPRLPSNGACFDKSDFSDGGWRRNEQTDGQQIESITPVLRHCHSDRSLVMQDSQTSRCGLKPLYRHPVLQVTVSELSPYAWAQLWAENWG